MANQDHEVSLTSYDNSKVDFSNSRKCDMNKYPIVSINQQNIGTVTLVPKLHGF